MKFLRASLVFTFAFSALASFAAEPLTVWIMPNEGSTQEIFKQRLETFTKSTGIETRLQVLDWGESWNRISTVLASGEGAPDILQLGTTWIPYFGSRKQIKPLNPWLAEIDSTRFIPVSWNTAHMDSDTTIYSIPWFIDVRPLLANKRILQKNGITKESVSSYNGFVEAIKKINSSEETLENGVNVRAFAISGKSDWNVPHNFAPWIWSNGGDFTSKDQNGKWHSSILTEKTLLGIAKYLNFILDSLVIRESLQTNTAQIAQQFDAGELGFIISTAEIVTKTRFKTSMGGLANNTIGSDSVVVLPIPKGEAGSISFIGGSNLAIPAVNTRPEAVKLLLFLTNDENLDIYTKQIGFLPPSKKILDFWANDDVYKELVSVLKNGKSYTAIPEWCEIEQELVYMFSEVWSLLEIPALYSEDKLYQILSEYNTKINKLLGYTSTEVMTFEEFKTIWHKVLNVPTTESQEEKQKYVTENLRKAPWIFVVMVFLGFLFSFKRKKK